jgi:type II secretory pathway component GspD/PulD (secretin)
VKESSSIIRIFANLGWGLLLLLVVICPLGAQSGPLQAAAAAAQSDQFDLPPFMQKDKMATVPKTAANEKIKTDQGNGNGVAAQVAPNDGKFTNKISVESVIVSPRQKLLRQPVADIRMEEVPIRDALRYLAEAAGINYILPALDTEKVTVNMHMPPFKAMEVLANNFGLGIYEQDGLWFIRKKDKAEYYAKIYKLKNIQLGQSTSGSGTVSTSTSGTNGASSTNSTTNSTTTSNSTSGTSTATNGASITPTSTNATSTTGQVVMNTLQEILGIDVTFGGTIGSDGQVETTANVADTKPSDTSSKSNANNTVNVSQNTYVSYDADANTLFVIATAIQHQWVEQYLKAIDNPTSNIAIEAMFLESSRDPSTSMGFDWSNGNSVQIVPANGSTTLNLGHTNHLHIPTGMLIQSQNFQVGLSAFQSQTDSQIAHYPSVVTQNGQQVQIQTTENIPLASATHLVSQDNTTGAVVGTQTLGTQQVGTTISITPRQINDTLVQLNISIQISTQAANTTANQYTGAVTTNNSTYSGMVDVPQGYTLAIGGLERVEDDNTTSGLPGVGDLPLFGFLFKNKSRSLTHSSIYLFITPTIMKDGTSDGTFVKRTESLSKDWINKEVDRNRAWRKNVIDPETDEVIKKEEQQGQQ